MRGVARRSMEALSRLMAELAKILASPNEGIEEPSASGWLGRLGARAPLLLLALAMAVVLLLNFDREHFYAPVEWDTAKNLAVAENLSPRHNFRLFTRLTPGEDGEPSYEPYSRFPIGGAALIKLVILPFGDNLAAKVFAARMLMLAFFAAAALLAYHSILRVSSNRWIALTATLTAFSAYYILRYHNQVSNEFAMDLFAVMLTFHGMIIFLKEGRFRQLVVKTCIALLIGWRAYSILVPFIVLGLGSELVEAIKAQRAAVSAPNQPNRPALLRALARSRYLRLGVVAVAFGAALLSFNVIQEYDALNGAKPLRELPSVDSIMNRVGWGVFLGFDDGGWQIVDDIDGGVFLRRQFYRVAGSAIPTAWINWPGASLEAAPNGPPLRYVAAGIILTTAALVGLLFTRRRMLLFTLAASGFIWSLAAPGHVYFWVHQHAAIFYVGVPLTLVTLLLLALRRLGGGLLLPGVAVAAFAVFALSASQSIASRPEDTRDAARQQAIFSDMSRIRQRIPAGKSVFVAQSTGNREALYGAVNASDFYLAGSRIRHPNEAPAEQDFDYDFVVIPHRDESFPLLTPNNRAVFLYERADPADLLRAWVDSVASRGSTEPAAQAVYDVSISDRSVVFVKEPCRSDDAARRFFLHVFPEDSDDLPYWRREHGYDNLDFAFSLWGVSFEGKCAASVPLPEYPISGVSAGQFGEEGELWSASLPFDPGALRTAYADVARRAPDAQGEFNLYLDEEERTLTYVKEPCAPSDADAPFFLHVAPEQADDLPEDRRDLSFDSKDFDFHLRGIVFDGKCVARIPLPEYAISGVRTGQSGEDGELWSVSLPFDSGALRAAYAVAASRAPDVEAEFDLYLDEEERTLTYVREPCAPSDADAPFFLHVAPERADDLPEDRREFGFDNKDFDFHLRGVVFDGKCVARVPLPEYRISSVRTGQWVPGEGAAWRAEMQFGG